MQISENIQLLLQTKCFSQTLRINECKIIYYWEQPRVGKVHSVFAETKQIKSTFKAHCEKHCNNRCPYISDLWPFKVNYNTQVADILQGKKNKMLLKGLFNGIKSFVLIIICLK